MLKFLQGQKTEAHTFPDSVSEIELHNFMRKGLIQTLDKLEEKGVIGHQINVNQMKMYYIKKK